jgi:hypothetical protein
MKQDFVTLWKNSSTHSASAHAQLCVLKAIAAKGDDKLAIAKHFIRKAFTPVSRTTKLANGRAPFDTASDQFRGYRWGGQSKTILGLPVEDILTEEEAKTYHSICKELSNPRVLVRRYSYFFTRQDIFKEYQLVQTAHVALELGSKLTAEQVKDLHFTCCGVEDLEELEAVERVLLSMKVDYVVFREPDIGNEKTAIGVFPVEEHKRGLLRNYNLLRFEIPERILPTPIQMVSRMVNKNEPVT